MKVRSMLVGAAAVAALALAPSNASAQGVPAEGCGAATYGAALGVGGALTGCFNFTLHELGEDAGYISRQFYFLNAGLLLGSGSGSNAPSMAGTEFFNDNCGSAGFGTFGFACADANFPGNTATGFNPTGEFVLGLLNPDNQFAPLSNGGVPYYIYSGGVSLRNAFPSPAGFQAVLMQLTTGGASSANPYDGNPAHLVDGEFLFAWEDINTGCTAETPVHRYFRTEDLGNGAVLDDGTLHTCTTSAGGEADADYNDSYIRLSIVGQRLDTVTPEPMTMTLMATGLVGLAGAQIRRRKKN